MQFRQVSFFTAVVAIFSGAATMAATTESSCKALVEYTSIDLVTNDKGEYLVPVSFGGSRYLMTLRLEIAVTLIEPSVAQKLGLKMLYRNISDVTAVPNWTTSYVAIPDFEVGTAKYGAVKLSVMPRSKPLDVEIGPDAVIGVLGLDLLSSADVDLDLAHSKLNLFSRDHCPGRVVYWAKDYAKLPMKMDQLGVYHMPMELNGKNLEAALATGSAITSLYTDASRELYGFDEKSSGLEVIPGADGKQTMQYVAMQLSAPGLSAINVRVNLNPSHNPDCTLGKLPGTKDDSGYTNCYGIYPLKLGLNVLKKLHLYLATKENMLYFTAADGNG
jgi:hypothetical protein